MQHPNLPKAIQVSKAGKSLLLFCSSLERGEARKSMSLLQERLPHNFRSYLPCLARVAGHRPGSQRGSEAAWQVVAGGHKRESRGPCAGGGIQTPGDSAAHHTFFFFFPVLLVFSTVSSTQQNELEPFSWCITKRHCYLKASQRCRCKPFRCGSGCSNVHRLTLVCKSLVC